MMDPVGKPKHYFAGGFECGEIVDALRERWQASGLDAHRLASAFEYLFRCGSKDNARQDAEKAINYLHRALYGTWFPFELRRQREEGVAEERPYSEARARREDATQGNGEKAQDRSADRYGVTTPAGQSAAAEHDTPSPASFDPTRIADSVNPLPQPSPAPCAWPMPSGGECTRMSGHAGACRSGAAQEWVTEPDTSARSGVLEDRSALPTPAPSPPPAEERESVALAHALDAAASELSRQRAPTAAEEEAQPRGGYLIHKVPTLPAADRESVARELHEAYRTGHPGCVAWGLLDGRHRAGCFAEADYVLQREAKLREEHKREEEASAKLQREHCELLLNRARTAETERDTLRAEISHLRGAMNSDDERLRAAEARIYSDGTTWGCDAAEHMADTILHLRAEVERLTAELAAQALVMDSVGKMLSLATSNHHETVPYLTLVSSHYERARLKAQESK